MHVSVSASSITSQTDLVREPDYSATIPFPLNVAVYMLAGACDDMSVVTCMWLLTGGFSLRLSGGRGECIASTISIRVKKISVPGLAPIQVGENISTVRIVENTDFII